MSVFVYREASSTGARDLAAALGGVRARRYRGNGVFSGRRADHRLMRLAIRHGDHLVCWGNSTPGDLPPGITTINGAPIRSKFGDAERLREAGVPTIEVRRQAPTAQRVIVPPPAPVIDPAIIIDREFRELVEDFTETQFARNPVYVRGLGDLQGKLGQLVTVLNQPLPRPQPVTPAAPVEEWLPRLNNHVGGSDLLHPVGRDVADFWVKKEQFVQEFRVHTFLGRSIRAGRKTQREDFRALIHPWVRSWDGGWRIIYDGVSSTREHRELAARAVAALGLQFGAVDIGQRPDGSLIVLEVNRAPGIEQGTITAYANAIQRWMTGEWTENNYTPTTRRTRRTR